MVITSNIKTLLFSSQTEPLFLSVLSFFFNFFCRYCNASSSKEFALLTVKRTFYHHPTTPSKKMYWPIYKIRLSYMIVNSGIYNISEAKFLLPIRSLKPGSHERHKRKEKINTKTKCDISSGTCEDKTARIFLCFFFCSALGLCLDCDLMFMITTILVSQAWLHSFVLPFVLSLWLSFCSCVNQA